MSASKSLRFKTILEDKISLLPSQQTRDLEQHLLDNIKSKMNKRVVKGAAILKVIRLISYDYGIIDETNHAGSVNYRVAFECLVFAPTIHNEITIQIDHTIKGMYFGDNGVCGILIDINNIDSSVFACIADNVTHIETQQVLRPGDYVRGYILRTAHDKRANKQLILMCKLLRMATQDEIDQFIQDNTADDDGDAVVADDTIGSANDFI
ncbi:DNA-directed RNA polymerase [uncultured virus]|nr:DNA-directed RNA polymerase [uncultured virus]